MEWSIQQVAQIVGTTSRALRHYHQVGLLDPSRVGQNGYRYYDADALLRLQRILLLRELGLGLPQIAQVLGHSESPERALSGHLVSLRTERERLTRQIAAVQSTIDALHNGDELMPEEMFDGFDHAQYEGEVTERWGEDAYARSSAWWGQKGARDRQRFTAELNELNAEWISAAIRGVAPEAEEAQAMAERHVAWLSTIPGTPTQQGGEQKAYLRGLADMYVSDARFAANYGGTEGAAFVRDALYAFTDTRL